MGKTLVGDVDVRHEVAFGDKVGDCLPLVPAQVHTGRVVATAMKQHEVAAGQTIECFQHLVETDVLVLRVVVGIGLDLQAGATQ